MSERRPPYSFNTIAVVGAGNKKRMEVSFILPSVLLYPRGESNPNRWNRNPIFYPLNYGDFQLTGGHSQAAGL